MKIVTIIGARPQFIKAAAVSRAIQAFNQTSSTRSRRSKRGIQEILIHTGQHYDYLMDQVFFEELGLRKCDYHLGSGRGLMGSRPGQCSNRLNPFFRE
jgi:UDP-GlcNAc3NAcA epimerase